ncbi:MAG TPA: aldo/keto reductase [Candidatus Hydrogenedentes bacterium]|nr:aldo/keto reductase [Candidatus Hydrogenedentota bacterium]
MRYRPLGKSGLMVSVVSFGSWQIGDPEYWGPDVEVDAEAAVHTAIDEGINLFDTAEMYGGGESERVLGKILGARRKEVFIATKVSPDHCAPEMLRQSCEGSLSRLGTDYIDLYQVHWPSRETPFEDTYAALEELRSAGKIREIGVSNFGPEDLQRWMSIGSAVCDQVGYNIVFRAPEYEVMPACRKLGLGTLAYMPLMQGVLAGRWKTIEDIPPARRRTRHFSSKRAGTRHGEKGCEDLLMKTVGHLVRISETLEIPMAALCLSWLLAQPGVTSAILGARNPRQIKLNLATANLDLGPAIMAHLNEISAPLKSRLGANADLWLGVDDRRIR